MDIRKKIKRFCRLQRSPGSIAVEAALLMPIFIFAFILLLSVGSMMIFHMKMQSALCEEARQVSLRCFDQRSEAPSIIEEEIRAILDEKNVSYSFIENRRAGIDFGKSFLSGDEYIIITATYNFIPFGANFFGVCNIPVSQSCIMHLWCGYINGYWEDALSGEYVYVTEDSEVYHKRRECSHIRLSVREESKDNLNYLRNSAGGKYYKCDICKSASDTGLIFITDDGTKYHNSITCSGLKRMVQAIRLDNIGSRRPCTRCGK